MSFSLHRQISKGQLIKAVPSDLRHFAVGIEVAGPFDLAVFTRQPVRIGQVKKALAQLDSDAGRNVILAGIDFTVEALELAQKGGAHVIAKAFFGWTEARYDEIRTTIATNKKRPL